jgi:Flp pilus assembly pilin Flp
MIRLQARRNSMQLALRLHARREDGQAMVEYALILALITIASITALQLMGVDVSRVFGNVNNRLSAIAT